MINNAGQIIAKEGVISIGFLSGLWIYIGLDPNFLLIEKFAEALGNVNPESAGNIVAFYYLISAIGLIISLIFIYLLGGIFGLFSVFLAFIGGIFIGSFGWIFLIVGYILGLISPDLHENYGY